MLRKLRSNRNPDDTLYRELKKEFRPYFRKAETVTKAFLDRYAKLIFSLMIIVMLFSIGIAVTLSKYRKPVTVISTVKPKTNPVKTSASPEDINGSFSRIMQAGSALRELIVVKRTVDSITAKKALTGADSVLLERNLDRLHQINQTTLKQQTHGH